MTTARSDFLTESEESAQGQDFFEAPGGGKVLADGRDQAEASGWLPPQVADNSHVDDEQALVAERRKRLHEAMSRLESSAARSSRQTDWIELLSAAATNLHEAIEDHVDRTEGPAGFLESLVEKAPRLAGDAALLERDHRALVGDSDRLASAIRSAPEDAVSIRRAVLVLLGRLVEHRQRGAELLYDAYNVELGDGD